MPETASKWPATIPDNYGTPEYEAAWIRVKLNLPADATTSQVQGQMHVVCHEAHGYDRYIKAHKCDDKQGEIARQSVEIERLKERIQELQELLAERGV